MTRATRRIRVLRRETSEADSRLVALVGLQRAFGSVARGLFVRCQLSAAQTELEDAPRFFETVLPDAIVIDGHDPALPRSRPALSRVIGVVAAHRHDERPVQLIVLVSSDVSRELMIYFADAGALLVPTHLQSYRQLAVIIRERCGLMTSCCTSDVPSSL